MNINDVYRIMNNLTFVDNQRRYDRWKKRQADLEKIYNDIDLQIRAGCRKGYDYYVAEDIKLEYIPYVVNHYNNAGFAVNNMIVADKPCIYIRW